MKTIRSLFFSHMDVVSLYTVSEGKVFGFFNLALMEKNMQVKFDLKLSVYSLVLNV